MQQQNKHEITTKLIWNTTNKQKKSKFKELKIIGMHTFIQDPKAKPEFNRKYMKPKENKTQFFFLFGKNRINMDFYNKKIIMKTTKISIRMHTFIKTQNQICIQQKPRMVEKKKFKVIGIGKSYVLRRKMHNLRI